MKRSYLLAMPIMLTVPACQHLTPVQPFNQAVTHTLPETSAMAAHGQAMAIHQNLMTQDFYTIASYIHPTKGMQVAMYGHLRADDVVLTRAQFLQALQDGQAIDWGKTDGKGTPLVASLADYLTNWVASVQYAKPQTTWIPKGNSLHNLDEWYSDGVYWVFDYAGSAEYGYLDWQQMVLVFEWIEHRPYLVALISDRFTI